MFNSLKKKFGGGVKKFSGKTDFLEAVCASSALVAFADGECSDKGYEHHFHQPRAIPGFQSQRNRKDLGCYVEASPSRAHRPYGTV